jgi:hypothetical protein
MKNFDDIPYQDRKTHKGYKLSRLAPVGKVMYYTGAAKFYHNGDGSGFVWRYYNPVSWVFIILTIIASILLEGIPETFFRPFDLGFGMDPYFKKNPDQLKWW